MVMEGGGVDCDFARAGTIMEDCLASRVACSLAGDLVGVVGRVVIDLIGVVGKEVVCNTRAESDPAGDVGEDCSIIGDGRIRNSLLTKAGRLPPAYRHDL
jgi:hypothetical protein